MAGIWRIIVPIEPRGQGRPRAVKRGKHAGVYKADVDKEYEDTIRGMIGRQWGERPSLKGPLRLRILAVWPYPKSRWLTRKVRPPALKETKPDASNVAKAVEDASNGILWRDDSQIADLRVTEIWYGQEGARPWLRLEVSEIEIMQCESIIRDLMPEVLAGPIQRSLL